MAAKGRVSNLLRSTGLIYQADRLRYYMQKMMNLKENNDFRLKNPGVPMPPDYLLYESFQLNYHKYFYEGYNTALWIVSLLNRYTELRNKKILDWGCGPGRIIRHLPNMTGNSCEYFATDYNSLSIEWCKTNLTGIKFNHNTNEARLPYCDNYIDIVFGISVFTHLSEGMHHNWYSELSRILKRGGVMFFTTQGKNFTVKLTKDELKKFDNGDLVVRSGAPEGHRTYSAFQPAYFMKRLLINDEILEHIVPDPEKGRWLPQDIWIVRKK